MPTLRIAPYRILSIDGEGLKGIIPLAILERLDSAVLKRRQKIMFEGTSTGALVALGFAKGKNPSEFLNVYITKGPKVFERSFWHEIKDIGDVVGPEYDSANRQQQ